MLPISLADTETTYQSWIQVWHHVFLLGEAQEMAFNGNWEQVYRAFACFAYFKTYSLGLQVHAKAEHVLNTSWTLMSARECQWVSIEHPMNNLWVRMNVNEGVGTAPEHPLNTHDCHSVSVNIHWVHMTAFESILNVTNHGVTMRKFSFVSELCWKSFMPDLRTI